MRIVHRALAVLLTAALFSVDSAEDAFADEPAQTPKLERILKQWAAATTDIQEYRAEFRRYTYNTVFLVEKRAVGTFVFEAPNRGRYEPEAASVAPDTVSRRTDPKTGERYHLEPDQYDTCVWTGQKFIIIDSNGRRQSFEIPPDAGEDEHKHFSDWFDWWLARQKPQSALPLTVALRADQLKRRYDWKLLKRTDDEIRLEARPLTSYGRRRHSSLQVIVDPATWRTRALRAVGPAGNIETVHVFSEIEVEEKPAVARKPRQVK